jgi:short-subunit dehydrogenase
VAYSDALRIEHRDAITVTTVYPGYIRTPIHDAAAAKGLTLEGSVPAERVEDAAQTLTRAALDSPKRDLATTRSGAITYAFLRIIPRGLVDWAIARQFGRAGFDESELIVRSAE